MCSSDLWNIKVHYSKLTGEWNVEGKSYDRSNLKAYNTYGTKRVNAYKIIEDTLNMKDVRVFDYMEDDEGKKKAVTNTHAATLLLTSIICRFNFASIFFAICLSSVASIYNTLLPKGSYSFLPLRMSYTLCLPHLSYHRTRL